MGTTDLPRKTTEQALIAAGIQSQAAQTRERHATTVRESHATEAGYGGTSKEPDSSTTGTAPQDIGPGRPDAQTGSQKLETTGPNVAQTTGLQGSQLSGMETPQTTQSRVTAGSLATRLTGHQNEPTTKLQISETTEPSSPKITGLPTSGTTGSQGGEKTGPQKYEHTGEHTSNCTELHGTQTTGPQVLQTTEHLVPVSYTHLTLPTILRV